jgi:hypothetical protein
VFTLQTLPPREELPSEDRLARASGFSLHAGVSVNGGERTKLEHLVRYVARPAVAVERLALTPAGNIRYTLKTPYRDGTTAIIFEPFDFLARLAALVPLPRVHLTRYHGVFAPASTLRGAVTPAGRGRGLPPKPATASAATGQARLDDLDAALEARLRHRHRNVPTLRRAAQGHRVSIEEPEVIERILAHRRERGDGAAPRASLGARAPPQGLLF